MGLTPATNRQIPEHSIMDFYNKQTYLGNRYLYALSNQEITSGSEFPLILLTNPAITATGFPSGYVSLFNDWRKLVCLTASQNAVLRYYLNPTIGANGTAKTPINLRTGSSQSSIANLYAGPTINANGTFLWALASEAAAAPDSSSQLVILDPGSSLLVTATTSSESTYLTTEIAWSEI